MTRAPSPAQRTRRLLNQAVMQRSHRRGELIRIIVETEPETSAQNTSDAPEQTSDDEQSSNPQENR